MKREGKDIVLRLLRPEDVTPEYVLWMADEEVTQFLEMRWTAYGMEESRKYVQAMGESSSDYLMGIYLKRRNEHIGNIKIGGINPIHRFAELGLVIGNPTLRGKGYGTEAIQLGTEIAFQELNLNKVWAGLYANNVGCYRAFMKAGYREVGIFQQHRFYKGEYVDEIVVERGLRG